MNKTFSELLNARPLNPYLESDADEVEGYVQKLVDLLRNREGAYIRKPGKSNRLYRAVKLLLLNLLYVRYSDPTRYVAAGMRITVEQHGFGYRVLRRVLDDLADLGLITIYGGFQNREKNIRYKTRIRSTSHQCGCNYYTP